ncbi:MAG: glycosyltransferase family 4 protein [bacterium]|nr:glycosyltransferase family 4 protein [bacterium]
MKLLLFGPASPYRGGIAAFTDSIYRVLKTRHETHCWNYSRLYPGFLFPGSDQYRPDVTAEKIGRPILDSIGFWKWAGLRKQLRREKFDAVLLPYWHPFFAPQYLAVVAKGTKSILIGHNVVPHEAFPFANVLSEQVLQRASGLLTLGQSEIAQARQAGFQGKAAWHPSPAYPEYIERFRKQYKPLQTPLDPALPTILYFGLIRDYKGVPVLLEAMKQPELSEVNLLVAGEMYGDSTALRTQMSTLGNRVHWIDSYLPDDEVPKLFATAQVTVLPYLHATSTGVLPLAYAAGVPAVVTKVGGLPDLVREGETGAIVPPNDPAALAKAISAWLFDANLKAKAKIAIPKMMQTMTFEALVDTLERELL